MALVASVDYTARRIYLSVNTADTDLDLMAVGKEVRALRAITPLHQKFKPMLILGGNVTKISDNIGNVLKATARYIQFLNGCLLVPYNGTHALRVITDCFTDDGKAGRDCFDRTPLSVGVVVDIDMAVDPVEIRYVSTGGTTAPTATENATATVAQLQATTIPVNIAKVNNLTITGSGTEAYPWGPVV